MGRRDKQTEAIIRPTYCVQYLDLAQTHVMFSPQRESDGKCANNRSEFLLCFSMTPEKKDKSNAKFKLKYLRIQ